MSSRKKKNAPKASSASKMKQGSLFSFFTRLPAKDKTTKPPVGGTTAKEKSQDKPNNNNNNNAIVGTKNSPSQDGAPQQDTRKRSSSSTEKTPVNSNGKVKDIKQNMKLAVFWPDDGKYYPATVKNIRPNNFHLVYEDGESEWIDLRFEKFRFIDDEDDDGLDDTDDEFEEEEDCAPKKTTTQGNRPSKRPRISDDDDEEFEMDDAPEDDDLEVDDDDDECIVDSDDEDVPMSAKKNSTKKRKTAQKANNAAQKATKSNGVTVVKATPKVVSTPAINTNTTTPTSLADFSAFSQTTTGNNHNSNHSSQVTPSPMTKTSDVAKKLTDTKEYDLEEKALPAIEGAINPAGSHTHNHLRFLRKPRDSKGRSPGQPGYDRRTLKVDYRELQTFNKNQKSLSAGSKQWWETKAQYFDTVLLWKTGKFYELHHMDADIGVEVCGFSYMKGVAAHAGFPEIRYGHFADMLVRAGYKVARCEQTETPDELKERKKKSPRGKVENVVTREVCSIMTVGTRTFCYLDAERDESLDNSAGAGMGPLLAIREKLLDSPDQEDGGVCEYGIVAVDAARAEITMGQFSDDALRGRLTTLLATFSPSEVLIEGGENGASPELRSVLKSIRDTSAFMIEDVQPLEAFPKSTAVDADIRRRLERKDGKARPWDIEETLKELHRRDYFPRASREKQGSSSTSRWPVVLRSVVEGGANLALSSLGAALFWLQRGLLDEEIMSMGNIKAYIPAECPTATPEDGQLDTVAKEREQGLGLEQSASKEVSAENTRSLALDGNCLVQLEILCNAVDHTEKGSLWSKINFTKSPHGSRLLRAWLLRPLFQKAEIDRRADAVEELATGDMAMAMEECRRVLGSIGDIERLLARIHSLSGYPESESENPSHPNVRAVLYETKQYTKRKVADFSKVLTGLRTASNIPELFRGVNIESGMLKKLVKTPEDGGCFPDISEELEWFFNVFDFDAAAKGEFDPERGTDPLFDEACDAVERIHSELERYKEEVCSSVLTPRGEATRTFKYINTAFDSKDKFVIELPKSVSVPHCFKMIGKRGSGHKQINKYKSSEISELIESLEAAIELHKKRKAQHMQHIFAQFDAKRNLWEQVKHATAMLDALGSLAVLGSKPGYCRPEILECPPDGSPCIDIVQGRHPCVESTPGSGEFIPNDLALGSSDNGVQSPLVLLLSGPNMGGKSTLLRQTCLICILAQIGGFVPADSCRLTPVDRIMTRLGASDRILLGHSTFFCELFETASALRQATRRSLIIFDELGRGTSSFDGTAIASACLSYIVSTLKCACLFATHYHSLLEEKKSDEDVRLGHMENTVNKVDDTVTFHYTLGDGACPASFGINVAKLASLPEVVLKKAKAFSSTFELEAVTKKNVVDMVKDEKLSELEKLWESMQGDSSSADPTE